MNANQIIGQVADIITRIVGYGILLLILAMVLSKFGVRITFLPALNATDLCYIAGAWWLWRGGKL